MQLLASHKHLRTELNQGGHFILGDSTRIELKFKTAPVITVKYTEVIRKC